ncbi:hypothetical protein [Halomarina litorea]|nr:hypothetical protein [Halomarina sp. BCD28]
MTYVVTCRDCDLHYEYNIQRNAGVVAAAFGESGHDIEVTEV